MATAAADERSMPRWQRQLLPAVLGADHADRGQPGSVHLPRSLRDWVVDLIIFGFALAAGAATQWSDSRNAATWLLIIDVVVGLVACLSLWVRRDYPLTVALVAIGASTISGLANNAAIAAVLTVAIYCVPRRTIQIALLSFSAVAVHASLYGADGHYDMTELLIGSFGTVAAALFGLFVRARRELVLSLHDRNRQLRAEQELRLQEARRAERDRIAREMHDVLAHRISLLSLHAGALEFRPDASSEEIAKAAQVIRVSARAAQEELREVIGVLRADDHEELLEPPQPTLADLTMLVEESLRAGMEVTLHTQVEAQTLPDTLGRTVYRLIQEALTNARKHAPGQLVTIELTGERSAGVHVSVVNRPRVGSAQHVTPNQHEHVGSGAGLIGVGERVALAGGTLRHGPLPGGGFELDAQLPWT
jgi:signal transduction histidine kinase